MKKKELKKEKWRVSDCRPFKRRLALEGTLKCATGVGKDVRLVWIM